MTNNDNDAGTRLPNRAFLAQPFVATFNKCIALGVCAMLPVAGHADEGGTGFWLPGQFGSLAAVQSAPGWSVGLIYYHASQSGDADSEFAPAGRITLGLDVEQDLLLVVPNYVFQGDIWGGQASLSVAGIYASVDVGVDATLTGPNGNTLSGSENESLTSVGDLFPSFALRWNYGVHNTMTYVMLGVPVGSYETERLANLGTNHWAADIGGGYTYLNTDTGLEFSATAGLTYNFENPDTNYQNGIDFHLDWGLSQFISEQVHIGLVGYFYHQLTADSGSGARLGDFKSEIGGIGPQIGYLFKMAEQDAYLNIKGYWDYYHSNKPGGWNAWLTLVLPL